jgi:hypothetical protein
MAKASVYSGVSTTKVYLVLCVKDTQITMAELISKPLLNRDISFLDETQLDDFIHDKVMAGFTCFTFNYAATSRTVQTVQAVTETL